jgi:methionyl-tRNA synthetase
MGSGETILNPNDRFNDLRKNLNFYKDYLDNRIPDYQGEDKEEKIEKLRQNIEDIKKQMNKFVEYDKGYEFDSFVSNDR